MQTKCSLLIAVIVLATKVFSQTASGTFEESYLRAQKLFAEEQYNLAAAVFKEAAKTSPQNPYEEYAGFYMALCSYRLGQKELAEVRFRNVLLKYPNWKKKDDVLYWLSRLGYERNLLEEALDYQNRIQDKAIAKQLEPLLKKNIEGIKSLEKISLLYQRHPKKEVAQRYAELILDQEIVQQDQRLLDSLIMSHNLSREALGLVSASSSVKKGVYHIAVFMPFLFTEENSVNAHSNFVNDLYAGFLYAKENFNRAQPEIVIHAFDTRADSSYTAKIIATMNPNQVDLIVGPLYSEPRKVVSVFSKDHQINMVNPLSDNFDVIGKNPFSFLFHASALTKAKKAAEFALKVFDQKKPVIVAYEDDEKNHLAALLYQGIMEENGVEVYEMLGTTENDASQIRFFLTRTYFNQTGYETDSLVIAPNSIGHIFVCSDNAQFGANVVSAVAQRGDSIPVIGTIDWLNYEFFDFEQLSQQRVYFLSPNFVNPLSTDYTNFQEDYIQNYGRVASNFFLIGYNCMYFLMEQLAESGTHFQTGFSQQPIELPLMFPVNYYSANDNQNVPVIKLKQLEFEVVDMESEHILYVELNMEEDEEGQE